MATGSHPGKCFFDRSQVSTIASRQEPAVAISATTRPANMNDANDGIGSSRFPAPCGAVAAAKAYHTRVTSRVLSTTAAPAIRTGLMRLSERQRRQSGASPFLPPASDHLPPPAPLASCISTLPANFSFQHFSASRLNHPLQVGHHRFNRREIWPEHPTLPREQNKNGAPPRVRELVSGESFPSYADDRSGQPGIYLWINSDSLSRFRRCSFTPIAGVFFP
jgi:hypothetical protein